MGKRDRKERKRKEMAGEKADWEEKSPEKKGRLEEEDEGPEEDAVQLLGERHASASPDIRALTGAVERVAAASEAQAGELYRLRKMVEGALPALLAQGTPAQESKPSAQLLAGQPVMVSYVGADACDGAPPPAKAPKRLAEPEVELKKELTGLLGNYRIPKKTFPSKSRAQGEAKETHAVRWASEVPEESSGHRSLVDESGPGTAADGGSDIMGMLVKLNAALHAQGLPGAAEVGEASASGPGVSLRLPWTGAQPSLAVSAATAGPVAAAKAAQGGADRVVQKRAPNPGGPASYPDLAKMIQGFMGAAGAAEPGPMRCYRCKEVGHKAVRCKAKAKDCPE